MHLFGATRKKGIISVHNNTKMHHIRASERPALGQPPTVAARILL